MKNKLRSVFTRSLLVFAASLLIQAGCAKSSDDIDSAPPPNAEEYVTWNIGGNKGYLASPSDSLWSSTDFGPTLIFGNTSSASTAQGGFFAMVNATATGVFPINLFTIFANNKYYVGTSDAPQINISTYGNVGQFISGTYTGMVRDSLSTATFSINGNFKVKRR